MPHNLILFGAGASHGSDTCGTPPLMGGLFHELKRFDPGGWGAIGGELARRFGQADEFEPAMNELLKLDYSRAVVLQRAMASYFFWFRPGPENLYARLAGRIRDAPWDGALATLNYERLLKLALEDAGVPFWTDGLSSPDGAATELCYPHGCCDLFCNIRTESSTQGAGSTKVNIVAPKRTIIEPGKRRDGSEPLTTLRRQGGGEVCFDDLVQIDSKGIRRIQDADQHAQELETSTVLPIMCYIEPDKRSQSGVSFIRRQWSRFETLVSSASVVAIIGVNVRCRDAHIWGPLAETPARIVYCAGASAARHYSVWAEEHRPNRGDTLLLGDFEDEFDTICDAVGL